MESPKTFQLTHDKDTYSLEMSLSTNQQKSIIMKLFTEKNKVNPEYFNSFIYDDLIKLSKYFKLCDTIEDIFSLICKSITRKEVQLSISEKAELCFYFTLPTEKIEEIKLYLEKGLSKGKEDNLSLEKLSEKIVLLEKKNEILENEINNLKLENKKLKSQSVETSNNTGDKILFDVMQDIFSVSKYKLSKDFLKHLNQFGLSDDYRKELFKRFNSKIRKIYDVKTDGDTLMGFMTKVFGKKNIVTFHSLTLDDELLNVQIAFLNGSFRSQNSKLYAKIEFDCIYIIFYEHDEINFVAKIRDNFYNNPVLFIDEDKTKIEEFFENNPEDKVADLFNEYQTKELNVTDLVIYEMAEGE